MEHREKQSFMLQSFTWQQFLVAALVLSSIWYLAVLLTCYRRKLKDLLAGKRQALKAPEALRHYWDNEQEFQEINEEEGLLGKSKLPEGVANVEMGSFGFIKSENGKEKQLGLVPDVIEELKSIFNILAKEDGSKADFFSLLQLVKVKYTQIGSSPSIGSINQYIRENAPFHLTTEELENLWIQFNK
jgi:hypothetical protein